MQVGARGGMTERPSYRNYKASAKDPRLMVPRLADDDDDGETTYYRLLPEGVYDGWEGEPIGAKQVARRHAPCC